MNTKELIDTLQTFLDHGANPDAVVLAFDPDSEQWEKLSTLVFTDSEVLLYTDSEVEK